MEEYVELECLGEDNDEDENDILNPSNSRSDNESIYPLANIKVEREQYPIFQLKRKYDKGLIILDPDFQREAVWKKKQKSELIESVLMGIPLQNFYLNENKNGELIVVDGKQRLSTFFSFLDNKFKLENLRVLQELNGLYYSDLEGKFQANLEDFQLITQVIKPPTPDRIKFDIFDRVNRGGTPLNNQEMRNALYQGKATKLLTELSKSKWFLKATCNSVSSKKMKDRYIILRSLSFYLWQKELLIDSNNQPVGYRNDIDDFLGKSMEYINRLDEETIQGLKETFEKSMKNNYIVFGENSFRRLSVNDKKQPINMILFESFGFLFSHFTERQCELLSDVMKLKCNDFLRQEELNKLLISDRGKGTAIPDVFKMVSELKEELIHAVKN